LNEEKADYPMMTNIMKLAAITILLLAVLFRVVNSQVLVAIVVCASAVLLVREAIRAGKYSWAVVFVAIAALFNPIVPIARSGSNILWLNALGLATFLAAALALRSGRRLTVLSITSRLPRRESL
jgi:branched-subunit amino acid transport protein